MSNPPVKDRLCPPKKANAVLIASITATSAFMFPASAFADENSDISVAQINMEQINEATNPGSESASGSKVNDYLDSQARQGNLVDEKEVVSASIESPLDGSSVDLVWNDSMSPTEMNLSLLEGEGEKASQVGLGVAMKHNEADMHENQETPIGMGYGAASDIDGMYLFSQDCFNAYFGPNYDTVDDEDHYMTTCYQKFAESGTVNWVYNRWGHWETAEPVTGDYARNIDFSMRTRPWEGREDEFERMVDWAPREPSSECSPGATGNVGIGGVGISFPIGTCENVEVEPRTGLISMGWIDETTSRNKTADYAMAFEATDDQVAPILADYVWSEVMLCGAGVLCLPGSPSYSYVHADSGW